MWIPTPLYEALPSLYVLIGTLLVGGAAYVGIGTAGGPLYLATGTVCILSGVGIHVRRQQYRLRHQRGVEGDAARLG